MKGERRVMHDDARVVHYLLVSSTPARAPFAGIHTE